MSLCMQAQLPSMVFLHLRFQVGLSSISALTSLGSLRGMAVLVPDSVCRHLLVTDSQSSDLIVAVV
jgi:hypothetical protein